MKTGQTLASRRCNRGARPKDVRFGERAAVALNRHCGAPRIGSEYHFLLELWPVPHVKR